ncbi:unnamed protein product, partial [Ilex paraguariensis]
VLETSGEGIAQGELAPSLVVDCSVQHLVNDAETVNANEESAAPETMVPTDVENVNGNQYEGIINDVAAQAIVHANVNVAKKEAAILATMLQESYKDPISSSPNHRGSLILDARRVSFNLNNLNH